MTAFLATIFACTRREAGTLVRCVQNIKIIIWSNKHDLWHLTPLRLCSTLVVCRLPFSLLNDVKILSLLSKINGVYVCVRVRVPCRFVIFTFFSFFLCHFFFFRLSLGLENFGTHRSDSQKQMCLSLFNERVMNEKMTMNVHQQKFIAVQTITSFFLVLFLLQALPTFFWWTHCVRGQKTRKPDKMKNKSEESEKYDEPKNVRQYWRSAPSAVTHI